MKEILISIMLLSFFLNVRNQCPKYTCASLNDDICAKYDQKNHIINSNICAKKLTCDLRATNPTTECSIERGMQALAGMWAPSNDMCQTGIRNEKTGICGGAKLGEHCNYFYDCDVDLYCDDNTHYCTSAKNEGEVCGGGPNPPFCKSYLNCYQGFCRRIGSYDVGGITKDPRMCKTHHINNQGECTYGNTLDGDILRDDLADYCFYNDSLKIDPTCSYRGDGQAVCGMGSADTYKSFQTLLQYLDTKQACSVLYFYGMCDNGQKTGNLKAAVDAFATIPYHTDDLQKQYTAGVSDCIKKYQFKEIWRMAGSTDSHSIFLLICFSILLLIL